LHLLAWGDKILLSGLPNDRGRWSLHQVTHPQAPYGPNCESKGEDNGRRKSWGTFPDSQHFEGRKACWSSGMGLGRMINNQSLTRTCTNQTTSWLVHNWSTFGARAKHGQTQIHKTHHDLDLREATTFPLYNIIFVWPWDQHPNVILSRDSQPKCEFWNSQIWDFCNFGGP
jgi:hypothetical protein